MKTWKFVLDISCNTIYDSPNIGLNVEIAMGFRELSKSEMDEVMDYFFSRGFESDVAGERVAYTEIVAESEDRPVIDVFRELTKSKQD